MNLQAPAAALGTEAPGSGAIRTHGFALSILTNGMLGLSRQARCVTEQQAATML